MSNPNEQFKMEFYRAITAFLLKQAPVIVICFVLTGAMGYVSYSLWQKHENLYTELKGDLRQTQEDLEACNEDRKELSIKVAALEVRLDLFTRK